MHDHHRSDTLVESFMNDPSYGLRQAIRSDKARSRGRVVLNRSQPNSHLRVPPVLALCGAAFLSLAVFACEGRAQRGDAPDARPLSPEETRTLFQVPPGFEVQLVAAEPDIQKPLNLAFDSQGRVWVTGSTLYPWPARRDALGEPIVNFNKNWDANQLAFRASATPPSPVEFGADSVFVLSDFDPTDGRARKVRKFADGLNIPIGVMPLPRPTGANGDTVLVFSIPAIWRLTDTDGDGVADQREKLYDGFGFKDTHGMSSNYWLALDGWIYGNHGFTNRSEIRDRSGRVTILESGNTYRFRPDGSQFELFVNGQTNPFGLTFDARGDLFTADSHSKPVYLLLPGGYYEGINREHDGLGFAPPITQENFGSSAIAGISSYWAPHFPSEYRGNLFSGNPVTGRINRVRLDWQGSSPKAVRQPDFLTSEDRSFRPVQVKLGPDGALWIADFYNPIIGHYEVPLTHPARNRTHGRIWRVVWRGPDHSVPVPAVPDLVTYRTAALVDQLTNPNLVVRSLATAELSVRSDATEALVKLQSLLANLIDKADADTDESAALALFWALERQNSKAVDPLLRRALLRPDSDAAVAALRVLSERESLPKDAQVLFERLVGTNSSGGPGYFWRLVAGVLQRHPTRWGAPLLLSMRSRAPIIDFELIYTIRLALKAHVLEARLETLREWASVETAAAEHVADACLAVAGRDAAEFLLEYLSQTNFSGDRAGEFARHAVRHLPSERFGELTKLVRSLEQAPFLQRFTFAEGLASVGVRKDPLPSEVSQWMRQELMDGLAADDSLVVSRALSALKPLAFGEKAAPLRALALDRKMTDQIRTGALRALDPNDPHTQDTLIAAVGSDASSGIRRLAAELLGSGNSSSAAREALVEGLATAPADLSLALAQALAKSEEGAAELVQLVEAGRVQASLLQHRYLTLAFDKRSAALRERATALIRELPPEDARLDAIIAQRVGALAAKPGDPVRGTAVFGKFCAACHRLGDSGSNLGPSLDGIGSRGAARIVEDILDPNRNVDPAFRLTTVTLKSGQTVSGMNVRAQDATLVLFDPAAAQDVALARTEIVHVATSSASAMPAVFESVLSEQEFFDLVAYLGQSWK